MRERETDRELFKVIAFAVGRHKDETDFRCHQIDRERERETDRERQRESTTQRHRM